MHHLFYQPNKWPALIGRLAGIVLLIIPVWGCSASQPPAGPTKTEFAAEKPSSPCIHTFKPYEIDGQRYEPLVSADNFRQQGIASWYGNPFHGKKTANGETYDMHAMTAAHKTLPMGTYVRVYNQRNGKTVVVRINDRGPYVRKRIIDLSYLAAQKLDIVGPGSAPVEIIALGTPVVKKTAGGDIHTYQPVDYNHGLFTFQIGAFKKRDNALRLKKTLARTYPNLHIVRYETGHETFYRVRLGKCHTLREALCYENHLIEAGFKGAFTVAE
jgi:rare lipoprotein A